MKVSSPSKSKLLRVVAERFSEVVVLLLLVDDDDGDVVLDDSIKEDKVFP